MFRHAAPCAGRLPAAFRLPLLGAGILFLAGCAPEEERAEGGLRLALVEGVVLGYQVSEVWHFRDAADSTLELGGDSLQAFLSQTVCESGTLYHQPARRVRERTDWYEWGNPLQSAGNSLVDLYYQERDEALLLLAYSQASTLVLGLPGPGPSLPGEAWALLPLRREPGRTGAGKSPWTDDDLQLEDPPLVVFRYPLNVDAQWTYRQAGEPWRIDKRVSALGPAEPDSLGLRDCVALDWFFDLDRDGNWDEDLSLSTTCDAKGLVSSLLLQAGLELSWNGRPVIAQRRVELLRVEDSTLDD